MASPSTTPYSFKNEKSYEIDGTLLGECNDGCHIYATTWNRLQNIHIKNWEYNRPADMVRIPEIAKQLKKQNYIDGFIYLVKSNETYHSRPVFYCYDGIHRIEALHYLSNSNNDTCSTSTNTTSQTRELDYKMVVHVYYEYDEMEIKRKFETLNKCIPVPEIYTKAEKELNMKNTIQEIVHYFYQKYTRHFSSNRRPNLPNENRDMFMEKITEFFHEHSELLMFHSNKLIELIEQFNSIMREKCRIIKMTQKQRDKCEKNDCFLFIRKNWVKALDVCYLNSLIRIPR